MKTHFISLAVTIMSLFILASCSNNEYQDAMDKGIKNLGEKDYHQASIYFEIALKEKEGDEDASAYFNQTKQLASAIEAAEQKKFDKALVSLQSVINDKSGLKTLQEEAQKLQNQILSEICSFFSSYF